MDSNTTSSEYIPVSSQPQYTQGNTISNILNSSPSASPFLTSTHLPSVGNVSSAGVHLGTLPSITISQGQPLPPPNSFQLDLHQGPPLGQADHHMPMLWFPSTSLRSHQNHLQNLAPLPPVSEVHPSRTANLVSVQSSLNNASEDTPGTDPLSQASVTLPSYHSALRTVVPTDDQVQSAALHIVNQSSLDHVDPVITQASLQTSSHVSDIQRSDILTEASLASSTLSLLPYVTNTSNIYSVAPSQAPIAEGTISTPASNLNLVGSHPSHNDALIQQDTLGNARPLSASTLEIPDHHVLTSGHIPLETPDLSGSDRDPRLNVELHAVDSRLSSHMHYHNPGILPQNANDLQMQIMRSSNTTKLKAKDFEPDVMERDCQSVTMIPNKPHANSYYKKPQSSRDSRSKDAGNSEVKRLEGLVETVPCYKCKLCPFICLKKKGVQLHVRSSHPEAFISGDESENDVGNLDPTENIKLEDAANTPSENVDEVDDNLLKSLLTEGMPQPTQQGDRYVCAKCDKGFSDLEACKDHISENHGFKFDKNKMDKTNEVVIDKFSGYKRPRGRPRKALGDSGKENATLRREHALRTRRKQKLPRKMQSLDDSSDEEETSNKRRRNRPKKAGANAENDLMQNDMETKRDVPKITAPLKKRGRPKGSKNTGITALRKRNPKIKINEEELGYRCDVEGCAIRMKSIDNLDYHRRCHIEKETRYTCPECHEKFDHWRNISVHLWRSHVIDMELYACDQCSYKTYSLSKLINMHKRIHSEERPFLCDNCGKGFKTSKQLRNHKVIHLEKRRQRSFRSGECDVCHRYFSDKRMLRVHKDTVHNKLRPFLCNYCGYAASCRSTLKMHMRQHTGEKPFSCNLCDYRTADHNSLRRHKMRHSGEKPYKCPFCSYACIQSSTYKTHLKNKHPGQDEGLMFCCNLCAFRTIKKENYITHMADHKAGTIPVNSDQTIQLVDEKVENDHTVLVQTSETVTNLTPLDGLSNNVTTAQVMFNTIEEIRHKIAIAAQTAYQLDVSSPDRYPILLGHLKSGHLEVPAVVEVDPNGHLDPTQPTHQEFVVHETITQEQVQQLAHANAHLHPHNESGNSASVEPQ